MCKTQAYGTGVIGMRCLCFGLSVGVGASHGNVSHVAAAVASDAPLAATTTTAAAKAKREDAE